MNGIAILLTVMLIPVFSIMMMTPYLTRKTESFGVSIPGEIYQDPALKTMRKKYVLYTGLMALGTLLLFILLAANFTDDRTISIVFTVILIAYIAGSFGVYLLFHGQMKQLKKEASWAVEKEQRAVIDTSFRQENHTYSNGWFIIAFLITGATVFLTIFLYDKIPEQIPMQYNFTGEVTNWAEKSWRTVLLIPVMQMFMVVLFVFINTLINRAKQEISAENPERTRRQAHIFRRRWSLFMIVTGTLLTGVLGAVQLSFLFPGNDGTLIIISIMFSIFIVIASVILAISTGQGGSRVNVGYDKGGDVIDRDNDRFWKLGQFYVNRNDPSLFLEKRFGVGWTVNFAHPVVWILLAGVIIFSVGLPILLGA